LSELELIKQITRLQRQVDSLIKPEVGRWVDWTPTVTQGVAVAVTVNYARYVLGNTVHIEANVTCTSGGTAANIIVIGGFPTAIQPLRTGDVSIIGSAVVNSATNYHVALLSTSAGAWRMLDSGSTNYFGINPALTLANGTIISLVATYERA